MKELIAILFLLSFLNFYSQTQSGFVVSANQAQIASNDLINVQSGIGFGIGLNILSSIHNSADLISEITYTRKNLSIDGYQDYNSNAVNYDNAIKYNIDNVNISFLYNQYLIVPNLNKFNLAVQGGLGVSVSIGEWGHKESEAIKSFEPELFSTFLRTGISGGIEQFRITLSYTKTFGNFLNGVQVNDTPDASNSYKSRAFNGKHHCFSIALIYYTDIFK